MAKPAALLLVLQAGLFPGLALAQRASIKPAAGSRAIIGYGPAWNAAGLRQYPSARPLAAVMPDPHLPLAAAAIPLKTALAAKAAAAAPAAEQVVTRISENPAIRELSDPAAEDKAPSLARIFDHAHAASHDDAAQAGESGGISRPAAALEKAGPDIWTMMERQITEHLGIALKAGKTREWSRKTRERLWNYPGTPLAAALAEALGQAHSLGAKDTERIAEFLAPDLPLLAIESLPNASITRFARTTTDLYAFSQDNKLFILRDTGWKLLKKNIRHHKGTHALGNKLYVGGCENGQGSRTIKRLYEIEGGRATAIKQYADYSAVSDDLVAAPVLHEGKTFLPLPWKGILLEKSGAKTWREAGGIPGRVNLAAALKGELLVGTDSGVYKKVGRRWEPVLVNIGNVLAILEHEGNIYVKAYDTATEQYTLHEVGDKTRRLFPAKKFRDVLRHEDRLFAHVGRTLYEWDHGKWKPAVKNIGNSRGDAGFLAYGDALYAWGKGKGQLYQYSHHAWQSIGDMPGWRLDGVADYLNTRYVARESRLFELRQGKALMPMNLLAGADINALAEKDQRLFAATDGGIEQLIAAILPLDWRDRILRDVAAGIASSREAKEQADPDTPSPYTLEGSDILDENGRSLFSLAQDPAARTTSHAGSAPKASRKASKLPQKSKDDPRKISRQGEKAELPGKNPSNNAKQDQDPQGQKSGPGPDAKEIIKQPAQALENPGPDAIGQDPGPGPGDDGNSWLDRRPQAIAQKEALEKSRTTFQKYKLEAHRLGLIGKIDGMVKKILRPTKHARLGRQHYHDGDEPDMEKHYDDASQGRWDTPIMRRWNRKIRRSAKFSLVLDISMSMGAMSDVMNTPLDYALLGIVAWIEVCQKNGLDFEVILFDDKQRLVHPFGKTINREAKEYIMDRVAHIKGGSTAIGKVFKMALDHIIPQRATHRFVIFATDEGQNTGESPAKWAPLAKKNRIMTIAMVIGGNPGQYKHFDHAVRVNEAKDFPSQLLKVLKEAIRAILGPAWLGRG